MNRPAIVMLAVGLLVGWLLGLLSGSVRVVAPATPPASVAAPRESKDDDAALRQELDQAMADNAQLAEQLHQVQTGTATVVGDYFLVPRSLLQHLNFEAFRDGKVSPDLIQFLHLTPVETTAVNRAIQDASSRLMQLQSAHARLLDQTATQTKVQVDDFADEGGEVRGGLAAQVQGILGPDRGTIFMQKATDAGEEEFANFGKNKVVVTVTSLPTGTIQCRVDRGNSSEMIVGGILPEFAHLFDSDSEPKPSGKP